jgi:hypothetical protein
VLVECEALEINYVQYLERYDDKGGRNIPVEINVYVCGRVVKLPLGAGAWSLACLGTAWWCGAVETQSMP